MFINNRAFYIAFPRRDAVRHEFRWTHYRIVSRLETENLRNQYLIYAVEGGWDSVPCSVTLHHSTLAVY